MTNEERKNAIHRTNHGIERKKNINLVEQILKSWSKIYISWNKKMGTKEEQF
jgi:hypothetical protein